MSAIKFISILLVYLFLNADALNAQTTFDVPNKIELNVKEDYPKYSQDVINATKWLEETDLDKEVKKRKQVSAFVLKWVNGCPMFDIELTDPIFKLYGDNSELLIIYLGGYSRYYLENAASATKLSATKAGLISMMNVYQKKIGISKSKEMEKLIKETEKNKLDEYISKNFEFK